MRFSSTGNGETPGERKAAKTHPRRCWPRLLLLLFLPYSLLAGDFSPLVIPRSRSAEPVPTWHLAFALRNPVAKSRRRQESPPGFFAPRKANDFSWPGFLSLSGRRRTRASGWSRCIPRLIPGDGSFPSNPCEALLFTLSIPARLHIPLSSFVSV